MRNLLLGLIALFTLSGFVLNGRFKSNMRANESLALPVAQAMARYHNSAVALKAGNMALTGTVSPTVSGLSTSAGLWKSCADANAVATILLNPRQASQAGVVVALSDLFENVPGIGLASSNQINVNGFMTALPCSTTDGNAVIYTRLQ